MRINKYLCGLAVGVSMLFASCNTDNIGAEYYGSNEGQGITFAAAKLTATAVQASSPQFQIPIYRSNTNGDYSGSVKATGTIDGEAADCFSVSGFFQHDKKCLCKCIKKYPTDRMARGINHCMAEDYSLPERRL